MNLFFQNVTKLSDPLIKIPYLLKMQKAPSLELQVHPSSCNKIRPPPSERLVYHVESCYLFFETLDLYIQNQQ